MTLQMSRPDASESAAQRAGAALCHAIDIDSLQLGAERTVISIDPQLVDGKIPPLISCRQLESIGQQRLQHPLDAVDRRGLRGRRHGALPASIPKPFPSGSLAITSKWSALIHGGPPDNSGSKRARPSARGKPT